MNGPVLNVSISYLFYPLCNDNQLKILFKKIDASITNSYLSVKQKNEQSGKLLKDHGKQRDKERLEYFAVKQLGDAEFLLLFRHFLVKSVDDQLRRLVVAAAQPLEVGNSFGNTTFRDQPSGIKLIKLIKQISKGPSAVKGSCACQVKSPFINHLITRNAFVYNYDNEVMDS